MGEGRPVGVDAGPGCVTSVAVAAVSIVPVALAMGRGVLVRDGGTGTELVGGAVGGFAASVGLGAIVEATFTGLAVACDAVTGAPIESGVLSGMEFSMTTGVMVDVSTGEIVAQPVIAGIVGCWVGLLSTTVAVPAAPSVILMLRAICLLSAAMSPSMCALLPIEGVPWIWVLVLR